MAKPPIGPTSPDAGVIAAKPAMEPVTAPNTLALPCFSFSANDHTIVAVAAEIWVTNKVWAASPLAAKPLPALKPNHPTQSMPVPITHMGRLCGWNWAVLYPLRGPTMMQTTNAPIPAVICTTMPPAKSFVPHPSCPIKPLPPQTQWQTGAYTKIAQIDVNKTIAENFIRSTNAPTINAGVMMKNVI